MREGDGNFHVTVIGLKKVTLAFKITQKRESKNMLTKCFEYFQCGSIIIDNRRDNTLKFQVTNRKHIKDIIIPHFNKFPMIGSKYMDYMRFMQISEMLDNKEH